MDNETMLRWGFWATILGLGANVVQLLLALSNRVSGRKGGIAMRKGSGIRRLLLCTPALFAMVAIAGLYFYCGPHSRGFNWGTAFIGCITVATYLVSLWPRHLAVDLTPTTGRTDKVLLEVRNSRESQKFHARCRAINDPESETHPRLLSFDLAWERNGRSVYIPEGDACNLRIARVRDEKLTALQYLEICSLSSESELWTRWNMDEDYGLDAYILEMTIFGETTNTSVCKRFSVKPGVSVALEMAEVKKASMFTFIRGLF